ncbi:MAG: hypothetical protein R3A12_06755 [Ignavibacteria bacterium]
MFIYSGTGQLNSEGKLTIDYKINEDFKTEDRGYYDWYRPYYNNSDYKYIIQEKLPINPPGDIGVIRLHL